MTAYGRKWSGPKYSKCYGSSGDEKVFPAREAQGRPQKRGSIELSVEEQLGLECCRKSGEGIPSKEKRGKEQIEMKLLGKEWPVLQEQIN